MIVFTLTQFVSSIKMAKPERWAVGVEGGKHKFKIRLVGGLVRDTILIRHYKDIGRYDLAERLEKKRKDYDFAVTGEIEPLEGETPKETQDRLFAALIERLIDAGYTILEQRPELWSTKTKEPPNGSKKQEIFDFTLCRKDIGSNGRHPDSVEGATFEEDAGRRDLTLNALYMDKNGEIHDYHNGEDDINNGIIRPVGDAEKRINEDALRILRYVRFKVTMRRFEFSEELKALLMIPDTWKMIDREILQADGSKKRAVSVDRIIGEFNKMMKFDKVKTMEIFHSLPFEATMSLMNSGAWLKLTNEKMK